ncbi:MAG: DUF4292 domain-containing protein [Bdellovibrionaceae bacterium]|nr:DUF4292 domain-containing protein [Bdellovibrio sp.]
MKKILKTLFLTWATMSALIIISACGSKPTQGTPGSALLIESKAQLKSKDDTNNVKIEIALSPNRAIRMEVSALLGYQVATVLMTPQGIQYALHTTKTYYQGPFNSKTVYPIFKQHIDPRILWKVIHGQNPQASNLNCQTDTNQRPTFCKGLNNLEVKWTYEDAPRKKIELKNNQFEMVWLFKDQSPLAASQAETFVLKKPDGYKEIIVK